MNKLKQLTEKQAELLAQTEKLDATKPEERAKLDGLIAEIKETDAAIQTEIEIQNMRSRAAPDLSKSEVRDRDSFDFAKMLRHLDAQARGYASKLDGPEAAILEEGQALARASGYSSTGVVLPQSLVRRNLTATGPQTAGGLTIATEKRGLLDDYYEQSVMRQAGATILEGLTSNIDLPRLVAGTTLPTGKDENAKADQIEPSFTMLQMRPNRLAAYIDISEQLLNQSPTVVEAVLRSYITTQLLIVSERAFFHGAGTKEATGILATSGIASVAAGSAKPTLKTLVDLETAIDTQNALQGRLHYVTNGAVRGILKQTPLVTATDSRRLLEGNGDSLNGYQPLFSNAIRRDLGSSGKESALIFGNFAEYVCSFWSGMSLELVRDKYNAQHGLFTLVASLYYDGGVRRPKAFAACTDLLTA